MQENLERKCNSQIALHTADAELWTTGSNDSCQLGHKGHDNQLYPGRVEALDAHGVCQVACGQQHMLAVADGGTLCAWGAADSGQLGKLTLCHYGFFCATVIVVICWQCYLSLYCACWWHE